MISPPVCIIHTMTFYHISSIKARNFLKIQKVRCFAEKTGKVRANRKILFESNYVFLYNRNVRAGGSGSEGDLMLFVGVDLVKIERWERILEKFPARAEKIFTPDEIAHCEKKGKKRAESYAALWGAREAAGKALGIGIFGSAWQDAYVTWSKWGAPELHLKGTFEKRARELGVTEMSISISHEDHMSIAVVVMAGGKS